jgi:diguanylate cyclase (GGDEF)-like protein/PAS domain S-box-containing protein
MALLRRAAGWDDRPGALPRKVTAVPPTSASAAAQDEQHRLAFTNAPIGIAVVALDGGFVRVNPALCRLTGYRADELESLAFQDITHPDDLEKDLHQVRRLLAGDIDTYQMEKRYRRPDGSYVWVELTGSIARGVEGEARYFIAHVEDMSDRVAMRALAEHRALHDPLTGLPNRVYLLQRLHEALEACRRQGDEVGVVVCDLDDFRGINDVFGHAAGDEVLAEVARRISSVVRAGDTAARLGEDEFVVLHERISDRTEVFRALERIRRTVELPVQHEGVRIDVSAGVGVAFTGPEGDGVDRLLRLAEQDLERDRRRRLQRVLGEQSASLSDDPDRRGRLVIVDDSDVVRAGLNALFGQTEDLSVVAAVATARNARVVVAQTQPDVALISLLLPDEDGIELCERLREDLPEVRCIVLSAYVDQEAIARAQQACVSAYLSTDVAGAVLVEAVRQAVWEGRVDLPEDHLQRKPEFPAERRLAVLSPRERQVVYLVGDGLSNRQIAQTIGWTEKTAKNYITRILHKLGLRNRAQVMDVVLQAQRERVSSPTPSLPRRRPNPKAPAR